MSLLGHSSDSGDFLWTNKNGRSNLAAILILKFLIASLQILLLTVMDRRIEIVLASLKQEIGHDWTIQTLANSVNLSESRLRHLFKQETGKTPTQYVKELRLRKSQILLQTTFLSIKEVANRVGLDSVSYFAREFKRAYGMSPTTYRCKFGRTGNPSK